MSALPKNRGIFYGGAFHNCLSRDAAEIFAPGTGESLGFVALAGSDDCDAAITAAHEAFLDWRKTSPGQRATLLRACANRLRDNADELGMLDSTGSGNPIREMIRDVNLACDQLDYFAGLVRETKGFTMPGPSGGLHFTQREPLGVVAKIVAYNHPFLFAAKFGAALAAGNAVIVKPAEPAPLSALRMAELLQDLLPPGVLNVVHGAGECGKALSSHRLVAKIGLIGSIQTGRAVLRQAAETLKPVTLELGGKNALIAFPDADLNEVANAIVRGMNFSWCGQSCGSTSRVMIHELIHDRVLELVLAKIKAFRPGPPTDPATTMGAVIDRRALDKIMRYIEWGKEDGARLVAGGDRPTDPALQNGHFVNPTVFADVTEDMRIAREEIFGPVLSVMKWRDWDDMIRIVNGLEYGLTCSIWTKDLRIAHETAAAVEVGYVWINDVSVHHLGMPFGGTKQSGMGREESVDELLDYTRVKTVNVNYRGGVSGR